MLTIFSDNNCPLWAPTAWGRGNGTQNKQTGNFPTVNNLFPTTFTSCTTAGDGHVYVLGGDSYFNATKANKSSLTLAYPLTLTDTNTLSFFIKMRWNVLAEIIFGAKGSTYAFLIYLQGNRTISIQCGEWSALRATNSATNTLPATAQDVSIVVTKDGGTNKIYLNNTEVTYVSTNGWNSGTQTIDTNPRICDLAGQTGFECTTRLYAFGIINRVATPAEIALWSNSANNLGLYGYSNGNTMTYRATKQNKSNNKSIQNLAIQL